MTCILCIWLDKQAGLSCLKFALLFFDLWVSQLQSELDYILCWPFIICLAAADLLEYQCISNWRSIYSWTFTLLGCDMEDSTKVTEFLSSKGWHHKNIAQTFIMILLLSQDHLNVWGAGWGTHVPMQACPSTKISSKILSWFWIQTGEHQGFICCGPASVEFSPLKNSPISQNTEF